MESKTGNFLRIIIAGFMSFLASLTTAQVFLYLLWLVGDPEPRYQLVTGIASGFLGLFVGGWITSKVMRSKDVWFSAFNGYLVGGVSAYYLLGLQPLTLGVSILSFVFAGMGGYLALGKELDEDPSES